MEMEFAPVHHQILLNWSTVLINALPAIVPAIFVQEMQTNVSSAFSDSTWWTIGALLVLNQTVSAIAPQFALIAAWGSNWSVGDAFLPWILTTSLNTILIKVIWSGNFINSAGRDVFNALSMMNASAAWKAMAIIVSTMSVTSVERDAKTVY